MKLKQKPKNSKTPKASLLKNSKKIVNQKKPKNTAKNKVKIIAKAQMQTKGSKKIAQKTSQKIANKINSKINAKAKPSIKVKNNPKPKATSKPNKKPILKTSKINKINPSTHSKKISTKTLDSKTKSSPKIVKNKPKKIEKAIVEKPVKIEKTITKKPIKIEKKVETREKNKKTPKNLPPLNASINNFSINSYVVYPSHGVGKIINIEENIIANQKINCYHIFFDKEKLSIKIPVKNSDKFGIRPLSTKTKMEEVLSILRSGVKKMKGMWSRRAQEYETKINSGDIIMLAEVLRDLTRDINDSERSYSERIIYETAIFRLACEYSAIYNIKFEDAKEKIIITAKDKLESDKKTSAKDDGFDDFDNAKNKKGSDDEEEEEEDEEEEEEDDFNYEYNENDNFDDEDDDTPKKRKK
ncbi:MAG: CarD family transcriptional regulator [Alphaproteobacteria bacterium]